MKNKTIIVDIDGTLADINHRRHFVRTKPSNWKAFNASMHADLPNQDIIDLTNMLYDAGNTIILASGRGAQDREVTEAWLKKHGVKHEALFMRAEGDFRQDDIIKEEILDMLIAEGYKIDMTIDDRDQVVDMWRRRGIRCLQVDYGDF